MSKEDSPRILPMERVMNSHDSLLVCDRISRKRKRNDDERPIIDATRKTSLLKTKSRTDRLDDELDINAGINTTFSHMNSQLLADNFAQRTRKFEANLSTVELQDRYISATAIRDTTSFESPRILGNLPIFLEQFSDNATKLWSASKKNGAPHTIIVAGAGLRAADLARVIRKFQTKGVAVAKLFAKHIKLSDAVIFLRNTRTGIAVGTPTRLIDLMDDGALIVDRLERIVIDASHVDQKKRGVLDMRETQIALTQWLNRAEFRGRLGASSKNIDLIFY